MLRTIIGLSLILATTSAYSLPGYRVSRQPKQKCEKVLVGEDVESKVQDIALELGEWLFQAKQKSLKVTAERIVTLQQLLADVRAQFTVSASLTEEKLAELNDALNKSRAAIEGELNGITRHFVQEKPANEPVVIINEEYRHGPFGAGFGGQWPPNSNDVP